MRMLFHMYSDFLLYMMPLYGDYVRFGLRRTYLQCIYRFYKNPIPFFIMLPHSAIGLTSTHDIQPISKASWSGWLVPQSQELSILSCCLLNLLCLSYTTQNTSPFSCASLGAWTVGPQQGPNLHINVRLKIKPPLICHCKGTAFETGPLDEVAHLDVCVIRAV